MRKLYVIDCRTPDGALDFADAQPESVFGNKAIQGITEDEMAKAIFARVADATLDGGSIARWPAKIDPRWIAHHKYW